MWNLREYRQHAERLSDHLPWAALIAPGVALNKDGSFLSTLRFRGPDVGSATRQELMAHRARLNNALSRLGSGWCVHVEAARQRAPEPASGTFSSSIAGQIEDERRALLKVSPAYESAHYLTLTYLPPSDRTKRASGLLIKDASYAERPAEDFFQNQLRQFERQVEQITDILAAVMPEVTSLREGALLSFLHDCVSDRQLAIRLPHTPCYLDEFLTDAPLIAGLSPRLGAKYLKIVSVRAYANRTLPCLLHALNELPIAFRWSVRYLPMDKHEAETQLKRLRRQWFARRKGIVTLLKEFVTKSESQLVDTDSVNKAEEITDALEAIGADCCSVGYVTLTITTWDEDESEAEQKSRAIQRVCDGTGLVSRVEDFNAVEAWLGSLPGHAYADVRRPLLTSLNLCDLIPTSSVWSGDAWNLHLNGPPLAVVHTEGSTPFRLNLHFGDVGHVLVLGPTGSGKSTLLGFLAAQCLRYAGAQVYFFDKGRSCLPLSLAVGGDFYDLAADAAAISFQPLASLDREGEQSWAQEWLLDMLHREGVEASPAIKQELWSALSNLATMPSQHRTLTTLLELVQDQQVREALRSFALDGPHGHLLDAERDGLQVADWQAFEMEALMNSPAMVPVLTYLFHRLEQRFGQALSGRHEGVARTRPTFLFLDEAWLFLADSLFARKIREWLKTLRKKNVAVIFATQSLADIADSTISSAILESCPTRIFLPNASAQEEHTRNLYRSFGLNDRQIGILQTATPKRDYYFQSPAGNRLFQLGLGPIARALCGGGSPDVQTAIPRLLQEHGMEGFAEAFLSEFAPATAAPTKEKTVAKSS